MLRRALARRIGSVKLAPSFLGRLWIAAICGSIAGLGLDYVLHPHMHGLPLPHILEAMMVAGVFGIIYFAATMILGVEESKATLRRFSKR